MELVTLLEGRSVYFDANVFIYHLEGFPAFSDVLPAVFCAVDEGKTTAATSALTLAEVLVKPLEANDIVRQKAYREILTGRPGFTVFPVTESVLVEAARLRASSDSLRLPDAIHAATAREAKCDAFLTNDRRLTALEDLEVLLLSSFARS